MTLSLEIMQMVEATPTNFEGEQVDLLYIYLEILYKLNDLTEFQCSKEHLAFLYIKCFQIMGVSKKILIWDHPTILNSVENQRLFSEFFQMLSHKNEEIILALLTEKNLDILMRILSLKDPVCVEHVFRAFSNFSCFANIRIHFTNSDFLEVILSHLQSQK